jgi:LysM repeat protein
MARSSFRTLLATSLATVLLGSLPGLAQAQDAANATAGATVPLAADAPARYTVQAGDTLWDISARFLKTPWAWPQIWHGNPQVKNPDLIYPGDVLVLSYENGQPQITLERGQPGAVVRLSPQVRSAPLGDAIPAIPYEVVAAFMSRPSVVSAEDLKQRPYVLKLKDDRLVGAAGGELYARRLAKAPLGARYNLVHVGEALKDPVTGDLLGYQGMFTGIGRVEKTGDPARLLITESARESLDGDLLFAEKLDVPLDFVPHAPKRKVAGRIISVVGGVSIIGQYQVVVINLGKDNGIEPGHVLAVQQSGVKVPDSGPKQPFTAWTSAFREGLAGKVRLPVEQAGLFLVFKAYDRLSYGLIVQAESPLRVGDAVGNP